MAVEHSPKQEQQDKARRSVRLALIHVALAAGILAFFVWSTLHRV
jgi:CHASE3 domain sensor protein